MIMCMNFDETSGLNISYVKVTGATTKKLMNIIHEDTMDDLVYIWFRLLCYWVVDVNNRTNMDIYCVIM